MGGWIFGNHVTAEQFTDISEEVWERIGCEFRVECVRDRTLTKSTRRENFANVLRQDKF